MYYALDSRETPKELRETVCTIFLEYLVVKLLGPNLGPFELSNGFPGSSWERAIETLEDLALDVPILFLFRLIDCFAAEEQLNGRNADTEEAFSQALDRFRRLAVLHAPRSQLALPNLDKWPEMIIERGKIESPNCDVANSP